MFAMHNPVKWVDPSGLFVLPAKCPHRRALDDIMNAIVSAAQRAASSNSTSTSSSSTTSSGSGSSLLLPPPPPSTSTGANVPGFTFGPSPPSPTIDIIGFTFGIGFGVGVGFCRIKTTRKHGELGGSGGGGTAGGGTRPATIDVRDVNNLPAVNSTNLPSNARTTTNSSHVFNRLETYHGIPRHVASERLHIIKSNAHRGPADNVIFDMTGNVFDPATNEWLGSLTRP